MIDAQAILSAVAVFLGALFFGVICPIAFVVWLIWWVFPPKQQ